MKVWNLFATLAAVGAIGLIANTAVAQDTIQPGGVVVTGQALTTPLPGTTGTFVQPGTPVQMTPGVYPGYSTYPGTTGRQGLLRRYSYYTPAQQPMVTTAGGYLPQQAAVAGGCCGAVMPVGYNAPMAGGCCGATAAPVATNACCDPCATSGKRRGLFRRY
jgi:hypothetical protein